MGDSVTGALLSIARQYARTGDRSSAFTLYPLYLSKRPDDAVARYEYRSLQRGKPEFANPQEWIDASRKSIAQNQVEKRLQNASGLQRITECEAILLGNPYHMVALEAIAKEAGQRNFHDLVISIYEDLVGLTGGEQNPLRQLGLAYFAAQRNEKALTTLKEFQKRYGHDDQQIEQLVSKELPSRIAAAEKSGIRNRLKDADRAAQLEEAEKMNWKRRDDADMKIVELRGKFEDAGSSEDDRCRAANELIKILVSRNALADAAQFAGAAAEVSGSHDFRKLAAKLKV